MQIPKKVWPEIIKIVVVVVLLYVLLKQILLPAVMSPEFIGFTTQIGYWGYLIVVFYVVLSHVFAPLAGTPGVLLGVTIYGLKTGLILLYLGSLVSATINFYISRKFGRKWTIKLVGDNAMKEIDSFVAVEGKVVLFLCRLLGFSLFDFISYAAGLTNIKFRDYFIITALTCAIPSTAFYFIFKSVDLQSEQGIFIWLGSVIGAGIIFGFIIKSYISNKKSKPRTNA